VTDTRRLTAALSAQAGDFDHPEHEILVTYVDGRADKADAEWVESHLVVCATCREDVGDLREMQQQMSVALAPTTAATSPSRWGRMVVYGSIAAGLALMAWAGGAFETATPDPDAVLVAAPTAAPAPAVPGTDLTPTPAESTPPVLTAADRRAVDRALATGQPAWPSFHDVVRGRVGTLLGDTPDLPPLTPIAPLATAVTAARPEFTWSAGTGAASYEVSVYDDTFALVATSGPLTRPAWQPDRDLPRGQVLSWQISATTATGTIVSPAPPQPEARFVILASDAAATIANTRARLANEPLALGIALAEAGLYREAEAALVRAAADARYDAARVRQILAAIREHVGRDL
jgi:hypothetical protein